MLPCKDLSNSSLHTKHGKPNTSSPLSPRPSPPPYSAVHLFPKWRIRPVRRGGKAESPHHRRPGRRRRRRGGRHLERMGQENETLFRFRSAARSVEDGHVSDTGGDDETADRAGFRVREAPDGREADSGNSNLLFIFAFYWVFS